MKRIAALLLALGLAAAPAALAQDWMNQFSPGQARDSRAQGKTVPLSQIFSGLKREYGGYQLSADLYDKGNGKAVYEIDWMTGDGRKMHFVVDAQSGAILDRRGA
ncbi:MAG: PepSY domain-containing protein [Hyphomonas sp.]|nr:PepSY domain-containing protein [Hyphomonas sp.]HRX75240.1 PepSY domain-containing protein [Hyphomonas sp.]